MPTLPPASPYARELAALAKRQHDLFHQVDENDEPLRSQIKLYWKSIGLDFPGVEVAWSAVFISFCVKTAGASAAEFKFAAAHSVFVHEAIVRPAAFRGVRITEESVRVGDILQNNRSGNTFDFDHAKAHAEYISHSAIVVARGEDHLGKFATTVGGNESDSIRSVRVQLNDDGSVQQRSRAPFICLLKNLK